MMGKRVIRLGDRTTHGGVVVSASGNFKMFGKEVARLGDKVTCPARGHGTCTIVEGDPLWSIDGVAVALEGHKTSCGASLIASLPQVTRAYEGMGASSPGGAAGGAAAAALQTARQANNATDEPHALRFRAIDPETGAPLVDRSYVVTLSDGTAITGATDANGYTEPVHADAADLIDLHVAFRAPTRDLDLEELA